MVIFSVTSFSSSMVSPGCAAASASAIDAYSLSPIFAALFGVSGFVGVSDSVGFSDSAEVFDADVLPSAVVSLTASFTSLEGRPPSEFVSLGD